MKEKWISDAARDALWFSAKIRFELSRQSSRKKEYEDRIYLFQCQDSDSAESRATEVGRQQEQEYTTESGDQVKVRFLTVLNVVIVFLDTPLEQGIEVYSERTSPDSSVEATTTQGRR